jgi:hypothetical protein
MWLYLLCSTEKNINRCRLLDFLALEVHILNKYISNNLPTFPEGVYSTIVDEQLLATLPAVEKVDESKLEEKPILPKFNEKDIGQAVSVMFRNLSVPVDPNCDKHKNGESNILYGSSILEEDNIYVKGSDQESQVARIQENWDEPKKWGKSELITDDMYFSPSGHTN